MEESLHRARAKNDEIILERWKVDLGEMPSRLPSDLGPMLPTIYKKSIILFRSLFTYSRFLPAWKFTKRHGRVRALPALKIRYRVVDGRTHARGDHDPDNLTVPLHEDGDSVVDSYSFGVTESPAGPFSVEVTYRTNCDFRVDDSEALLSSRFMGADDEFFRPSIPSDDLHGNPETGSLPIERKMADYPDRTRAYGSLSTFHQVGPTMGASPISTLRTAARDSRVTSPSPPSSAPSSRRLSPARRFGSAGRPSSLVGDGGSSYARRPSISFQPFKAPPLSASPSLVDQPSPSSARAAPPRTLTGTSSDARNMPSPLPTPSSRRQIPGAAEHAIASSNSASPKPAPISRYSSSFSHRRGRPSSGGTNRADDDSSSGRASATSSAQPGSGLIADATGTSADSIQADDQNISDFLKELDQTKDLLNPTDLNASARNTTAALNRFQRMRDSNAALSDSMSSSLP